MSKISLRTSQEQMGDSYPADVSAWSKFVAKANKVSHAEQRAETLDTCRAVMRRIRPAVESIIDRLTASGYKFAFPENVHVPPDTHLIAGFEEFAAREVYVPIAFQAWFEEIGCINLMGTDLAWPATGYEPEWPRHIDLRETGAPSGAIKDVYLKDPCWLTDPLVVECERHDLESLYREWQLDCNEVGLESIDSFAIEFAPDILHKAGISGGAPYCLSTDSPRVDSIVLNDERRRIYFVEHVRRALQWGGFPGFEDIEDVPSQILAQISTKR